MDDERRQVDLALAELESLAEGTSLESLRDGSWLVAALDHALGDYAAQSDLATLRARWPDRDLDGVSEARIEEAQRRAALAGGLSAGA